MTYIARETSQYSGEPYELYLFQTEDQVWRMTSGDVERTYQGQTYLPVSMQRTNFSQGAELKSGACKVTIPIDHEIARLFVSYIPSTPLSVVIFRAHDGEAESQTVVNFTGRVTFANFGNDCELNCAPEQDLLKRTVPNAPYQKPCSHILFAPGCNVDRVAYRVAGVVSSISPDRLTVTVPACDAKDDGWFKAGYIEKGVERRMITEHTGQVLTLINGMPGLSVGDTVFCYAGCMRDYATCCAKFANGPQFFGFEWIPAQNPFDGGIE